MRSGCGQRWAAAILGRVIPALRRAAVAARSSVAALHQDEARPAAAEKAAQDLQLALPSAVAAEVRWAFTPPRSWLSGVAANLVLALVWLLVQPLHLPRHHDWVVLIGTYFSSFILADVTTTNMLGADHIRVRKALHDGVPLWRVLLVKNLALVVIVGLPTIAAATAMTPIATRAAIGSASASTFPRLVRLLMSFLRSPCLEQYPAKFKKLRAQTGTVSGG